MKVIVATAFVTCVISACAVPSAKNDISSKQHEVAFSCTRDESLSVRYFPAQGVAVLLRNGDSIELQQQTSASGYLYSNGPTTIRGKGDDLTVEIGRMVPLQCKAN